MGIELRLVGMRGECQCGDGGGRRGGAARLRLTVRRDSIMVKRAMLAGFAMVFVVGLSVAGQDSAAKSGSWSGVVTNDMCGAKDASAAKAECTSKCVKSHGAKYALYDEADKKVYILEPQDKADGHAIHVTSLTMNTAKGS